MTNEVEIKTIIPPEIVMHAIRGKLVPFIGAGFSVPFGYPSWKKLIVAIKDSLEIEDLDEEDFSDGDPLQIAQALFHYYTLENFSECEEEVLKILEINATESKVNEELKKLVVEKTYQKLELEFSEILLNLVEPKDEEKNVSSIEKLKLLDKIPLNYVITTNYDQVLETEVFETQKFNVQSLGKNEELDWNERDKTILKIHGDLESSNGIIFTHSQYYKFMNEHGYFRSKLYTTFSSNIVLMMGYGFNDINVHQIYFQFLRDYGQHIKECKFYMVLTEYDKKRWKSYFDYYKLFLESYKIEIILVKDLPTFINDLYDSVIEENQNASLSSLFINQSGPEFSNLLIGVIDGEETIPHSNKILNKDILRAFIKIFDNDFILSKEPFDKQDRSIYDVGLHMLDFTIQILELDPTFVEEEEYMKLLFKAAKFVDETNDFYAVAHRLKRFIELSKFYGKKEVHENFGEVIYKILDYCHPSQFLKSNPGGRLLLEDISLIPEVFISQYLNEILEDNFDEDDDAIYINSVHKYWLNVIEKHFDSGEISKLVSEINSKISNS